jgi:hypothetical protein
MTANGQQMVKCGHFVSSGSTAKIILNGTDIQIAKRYWSVCYSVHCFKNNVEIKFM